MPADRPDRPDGPYPARWACTVCAKANNVGRRLTCQQCGTLAAYTGSDRERLRQIECLIRFDVDLRQWISSHLPDSDFFVQLQLKLQERRRREWFVGREHRARAESGSSEPEPVTVVDSDPRPPPKDRRRSGSGSGTGVNSYLANHIMASRARWQCPLCENVMLARHTYCRKCHYRRDLTLESSKLPTRNRPTVQACLLCHGKVFDGQDQCRQCLQKSKLKSNSKSKPKRQVSRKPPDVIELLESEEESEHELTASDGQNEIVEIETNLGDRSEAGVEIVDLLDPPSSPASSLPPDPNEITLEEEEVEDENQNQDLRNIISIG